MISKVMAVCLLFAFVIFINQTLAGSTRQVTLSGYVTGVTTDRITIHTKDSKEVNVPKSWVSPQTSVAYGQYVSIRTNLKNFEKEAKVTKSKNTLADQR